MAHRILLELHTICLISSADQENYLEIVVALIIRTEWSKQTVKSGLHCLLIQLEQHSMVHHPKCCPVPSSDDLCTCEVLCCYTQRFRRRSIYKKVYYLTLTLGLKVTQNVAQYTPHHVTYTPAKFEVVTSNCLEGYAFTRKYII